MGNGNEKQKVAEEIQSMREKIFQIHSFLDRYKVADSDKNKSFRFHQLISLQEDLEKQCDNFCNQYMHLIGTQKGYRILGTSLITLGSLKVDSPKDEFESVYRSFEESEVLLLDSLRNHFAPQMLKLKSIGVTLGFDGKGPHAGVNGNFEVEPKT